MWGSRAYGIHILDLYRLDLHKKYRERFIYLSDLVLLQPQTPRIISDHDIYVSNVSNMWKIIQYLIPNNRFYMGGHIFKF